MVVEIHIEKRIRKIKLRAADKYNLKPEECHIGHVVLQAMLDDPLRIHQIDAVNDERETNAQVAQRSMRLANAMTNFGLKVGNHVVLIGYNHLDLAIPFFACHYNGYAMCAIDPNITLDDLKSLFRYMSPKMVFCPQMKSAQVKEALAINDHNAHIVPFDDDTYNMETFVRHYNGTDVDFRPAEFDQDNTICWLMLTSGTTGLPKIAIIPFSTLLNGLCDWWGQFTDKFEITMAMATIQWMSSLFFFVSAPLMMYSRVQSSVPLTPQLLVRLINKYQPNVTAWTPYLLGQFLTAAGDLCNLSCFRYIAIGGSAIDRELHDRFQAKCPAYLYLVYGMTELLVPVFEFNKDTPFGSVGKPYQKFQYRLVGDDGKDVAEVNKTGELWLKGDSFFKGYLNNLEETKKIITEDGWYRTGDIFYRDEHDYYHFVERKRLLIKYCGFWISPLQLEEIIMKHPGVQNAAVAGIPDKDTTETPVAAIVRKPGVDVEPQEIFDLIASEMPDIKQLHGGLYFVDALPETPSGKVHRAKLRDQALVAKRILPNKLNGNA